ncbi:HNH endonuclease [Bdellovibrio sp. GT3]|uniref:HNH endonuclease n=1 Tax=Bdellovibrio sp. GT3 TaxID=3136282 RepID=UPI0030F10848
MNLSALSNEELTGRLEKLAHSERKITHLVLNHINEMESRRLYAELGFDSMFRYLTRHLKYSEDAAYRRLSAARILKQAPQVAEKLENGTLTLTQLTQVQNALKLEAKINPNTTSVSLLPTVLEKIESKTSFETKSTLAKDFNLPIQIADSITPQKDDSVRFEITLTQEQMKTLESARDLMSHLVPDGNWADLLTVLAEKQIHIILGKELSNHDAKKEFTKKTNATVGFSVDVGAGGPLSVATTDLSKSSCVKQNSTQSFLVARKRSQIKITDKRNLLTTADYCCEYRSAKGIKCNSKYQLQIDHIQPIALGGNNEPQNLRVLCRAHNLTEARRLGLIAD